MVDVLCMCNSVSCSAPPGGRARPVADVPADAL